MSYDLMVFKPEIAPNTRPEFMSWYHIQTQWSEGHSYDDPEITSDNLKAWFIEVINSYPAMNGPYAKVEDEDDECVTDYSIWKDVIYAAFSWSIAEQAYVKMKSLAEKHKVGFFDASANEGNILFPDINGKNKPINNPGNLSSIQQIKQSASPGQKDKSVQEIIYSKVIPHILDELSSKEQMKTESKSSWWKKLFGIK